MTNREPLIIECTGCGHAAKVKFLRPGDIFKCRECGAENKVPDSRCVDVGPTDTFSAIAENMKQSRAMIEGESSKIHRDLDRRARIAQICHVYLMVSVYLLIRTAVDGPRILQPFFASQLVDVLLLKGGAIASFVVSWIAYDTAPAERPAFSVEGRYTYGDYLRKHTRVLKIAPLTILVAELLIDVCYLF